MYRRARTCTCSSIPEHPVSSVCQTDMPGVMFLFMCVTVHLLWRCRLTAVCLWMFIWKVSCVAAYFSCWRCVSVRGNTVVCMLCPTQSSLCSIMCVCCVERILSESPLITCGNCKVPSGDSRRQSTVWTTRRNTHARLFPFARADDVKWLRSGLQMHSRYGTVLGHVAQLRLICC